MPDVVALGDRRGDVARPEPEVVAARLQRAPRGAGRERRAQRRQQAVERPRSWPGRRASASSAASESAQPVRQSRARGARTGMPVSIAAWSAARRGRRATRAPGRRSCTSTRASRSTGRATRERARGVLLGRRRPSSTRWSSGATDGERCRPSCRRRAPASRAAARPAPPRAARARAPRTKPGEAGARVGEVADHARGVAKQRRERRDRRVEVGAAAREAGARGRRRRAGASGACGWSSAFNTWSRSTVVACAG